MKKVLVAVDGSEPAERASKLAADLVAPFQASLLVVHVCVPIPYAADPGWMIYPEMEKAQREQGEKLLAQTVEKLRAHGALGEISTALLQGAAADAIAEAAESHEVDLVVVGNRGYGAVRRMLLGSVADRVVHVCKRPVLVTR